MSKVKRGSEWRKWDLHVHTKDSYDAKYKGDDYDELLVQSLKDSKISAVAITDHFIISKERIEKLRKLTSEITFFPGVELRSDKGAPNLHVILIFSEKAILTELVEDFNVFKRSKGINSEDNEKIYWDYNHIVEFAERHKAIVSVHAGDKSNGVDKEIKNNSEHKMAIKEEISKTTHIYEVTSLKDIEGYKKFVIPKIGERAIIICSDCHDPKNYNSRENLWIKGEPTFDNLKLALTHPNERIHNGFIPPKLESLNSDPKSYIKNIKVNKVDNAKHLEEWFNINLPLNPGLNVIIGNKGSGKSALSDIIAFLCKSKTINDASFLCGDRFNKPPKRFAEDYSGYIEWYDGKEEGPFNLGASNEENYIENAHYLPQKYIEKLCNELGDDFQEEIDKVIFSYIEDSEKGNIQNLKSFISKRCSDIYNEIFKFENELSDINLEIISLEEKLTSSYKKEIYSKLDNKKEELLRHEKSKPLIVEKPKEIDNEITKQLSELNDDLKKSEMKEQEITSQLKNINTNISILKSDADTMKMIFDKIEEYNKSLNDIAHRHNLNPKEFTISYGNCKELMREKNDVEKESKEKLVKFEKELLNEIEKIRKDISEKSSQATQPEKAYQKYLEDLKDWGKRKLLIIGDDITEDTMKFYEKEKNYLDLTLPDLYILKKEERIKKIKEIFSLKKSLVEKYKLIYGPIDEVLSKSINDSDESQENKIEFLAEIVLDKEFGKDLLSNINKNISGKFYGKSEASVEMEKMIKEKDFSIEDNVVNFIEEILLEVSDNIDLSLKKINNKLEFYNKLSQLKYLNVKFTLKMNGNSLQELSPGERGLVLLIFYLALSKNDSPIIIDQPEDNLDNQSVYQKLASCIRESKNRRQVIIVTHNPNIAIACDAEQVIFSSIDKVSKSIKYINGGIEEEHIRSKIIEILEGTQPAFNLRKIKYFLT